MSTNLPKGFKNSRGIVKKCYGKPLRVMVLQNVDGLSG